MASHYRRERIENFYHKLRVRRAVIKNQMEQKEFESFRDYHRGEIAALNQVIAELKEEFDIQDPNDEGREQEI